ncbi:DUF1837 domain-containing protein, partial [bacterium]|nr:DUF1837 domain-containing protein [bacterium]
MSINGINVKKEDNCLVCYIENFSKEIQGILKEKLSKICHGSEQVDESEYYSYNNTVKQFYARYQNKTPDQKKGLMGELLTNLLFDELLTSFKLVSIFFNKEELSLKKGFDLVFVNLSDKTAWYSEVKSGHCNASCVTEKTVTLLNTAKNDIKNKFTRDNLWNSVLVDLNCSFKEGKIKDELKKLFQSDATNLSKLKARDKRVIIASVVYETLTNRIDFSEIKTCKTEIEGEKIFSKII